MLHVLEVFEEAAAEYASQATFAAVNCENPASFDLCDKFTMRSPKDGGFIGPVIKLFREPLEGINHIPYDSRSLEQKEVLTVDSWGETIRKQTENALIEITRHNYRDMVLESKSLWLMTYTSG